MDACLKPDEIEAFVAETLAAEDRARCEAHVASCSGCRRAISDCRRDGELARGIQRAYEKATASDTPTPLRDGDPGEKPSAADSIPGYQLLHEIHRGGQGVVYKAVQLATKRTVALKVLLHGPYASARQQHRFEREIDLVASLQHPNIVTVYDSGLAQGRHYFAMEYIHGRALSEYLSEAKPSIDATLRLFQKICVAVNAAHQRGVIHRDLKPGNIRIDTEGEPHILDFGLAKAAGSDLRDGAPVTVSGEFMGTLAYASPEQTHGDPTLVDIRTDVYSLGVILFEMLTGEFPYDVAGHITDVLRNIAEVPPCRPSTIRRQINDEVETIVLQALAKERERRYQSADALARDVGRYLAGEALEAKRDSTWYVLRKSLRRYYLLASVAAAFALMLAGSTIALSVMYRAQSRAREDAEAAQRSEAEQRALAEKRADELEIVTEFQQSMLSEIDAAAMGRALYADLRARLRAALEREGFSVEECEEAVADFDQALRRTNATDAALKLVDEQVLNRAVEAIESDFADQPIIRAALQQTVADTYCNIGRFPPALPLQEAALRTRRAELGNEHPDTLTSISNMGNLLTRMGELRDAFTYYQEALEGRRRVLGDQHTDTINSINRMGLLLKRLGKFAEAEPYYREVLEGCRRELGKDDSNTLSAINNLGVLLQAQGKLAEAEPYYREALEGRRRVLGDTHADTLNSLNGMGRLLAAQGKLDEAEPYYREALEGRRRVLGDRHPDTLSSVNNMGSLLDRQGKLAEAETYYREALEGYRRALGSEHSATLYVISNLGLVLQKQGKLVEAEPYFHEALEGRRRVLGDDHPHTLQSINNMGFLLNEQGEPAEAEHYLRAALEARRRVLGDDHPDTLLSVNNLGVVLDKQGKSAEAERYYREALEGRRRVLGDQHPDALGSMNSLAGLLLKRGDHAEAAALLIPAEAAVRQAITGGNASRLAGFLVTLGRARTGLGFESERFALAEANLMEAHSIFVENRGATHADTRGCVQGLVDLYDAWHAAEPNAGYAARAAAWREKLADPTSAPAARQ